MPAGDSDAPTESPTVASSTPRAIICIKPMGRKQRTYSHFRTSASIGLYGRVRMMVLEDVRVPPLPPMSAR